MFLGIRALTFKPYWLILVFLGFYSTSSLAVDEVSTGLFSDVAVKGYDTVAYFTQNKPVKGKKKYAYKYKGATWRFASQAHLDLFKNNPEKYTPQYGGYCAYAVSQNSTAPIDPTLFSIHNDKLYLNYNKTVNNRWNEDRKSHIADADKYWQTLAKK